MRQDSMKTILLNIEALNRKCCFKRIGEADDTVESNKREFLKQKVGHTYSQFIGRVEEVEIMLFVALTEISLKLNQD